MCSSRIHSATLSLRRRWKCVTDASIEIDDHYGWEIVSPKLKGDQGLREIRRVLTAVQKMKGRVGESCGHHVHVDAESLSFQDIKRIAQGYLVYEQAFDLMQPVSRQLDENKYLRSNKTGAEDQEKGTKPEQRTLRAILALEKCTEIVDLVDVINPKEYEPGIEAGPERLDRQRYYKLNLTNLVKLGNPETDRPFTTIEFR